MVICLAVIRRQPSSLAGFQECSISPAVDMDGVDENDLALIERKSDGRWRDDTGRVKWVECTKVVVEYGAVIVDSFRHGFSGAVRRQWWCHAFFVFSFCA